MVLLSCPLSLVRKRLVSGRTLSGCLVSGGMCSLTRPRWQQRLLWKWFLWTTWDRLVPAVSRTWISIRCLWPLLRCLK